MNSIFQDIHPRALKAPIPTDELLRTLRECTIPSLSAEKASTYVRNAQYDLHLFDNCIDQLRIRQAALRRDIDRYGSLHSSIRKLPPEILRRILVFACTPVSASGSALRLAFARSGKHPLSLRITDQEPSEDEGNEQHEVLRFLVKHSHRWGHVDFSDVCLDYIELLQGIGPTPLLESIVCPPHRATEVFAYLTHSPRLRHFECESQFFDLEPFEDVECFPWDTMHHLNMTFERAIAPLAASGLLRLGVGLQSLVFAGGAVAGDHEREPYERSDELPDPVISNLTALAVHLSDAEGFYSLLHDFIQCSTLSSLESLHISLCKHTRNLNNDYQGKWPHPAVYDCFERSGCKLTKLTLEGIPLDDSDVIALTKLNPLLRSFTMTGTEPPVTACKEKDRQKLLQTVTRSFLKRLVAPTFIADAFSPQQPLLPKLRYLKLEVQPHFDADEVFVEVIRSRWIRPNAGQGLFSDTITKRLREVVLNVMDREVDEKIYVPLQRIDEEGLMVSIFGDRRERVI
ncbi:hypothetical protein PQX77_000464 [Marasmius sp. AFHP31]|nr:hypothetical protein PQX77_000464 [Marasmius sp. AFHP31]